MIPQLKKIFILIFFYFGEIVFRLKQLPIDKYPTQKPTLNNFFGSHLKCKLVYDMIYFGTRDKKGGEKKQLFCGCEAQREYIN